MNVNFTVFIDKILSGEKRQTIRRASPKWENVKVGDWVEAHTPLGDFMLYYPDLEDLSGRDGFDSVRDFFLFFYNTYIERELEMVVIRWADFKEAKQ